MSSAAGEQRPEVATCSLYSYGTKGKNRENAKETNIHRIKEKEPQNKVRERKKIYVCFASGSRKSILTAVGIRCADHATPSICKFGTNFADMRLSLSRYSSFDD
jgi:hypothetical protein